LVSPITGPGKMALNAHDKQWEYLRHDTEMYRIIQQLGYIEHKIFKDPFVYLLLTVAGQQLSVKAAASINEKFKQLLPAQTPEAVLQLSTEQLRSVGFSYRKASCLHHIARFWLDHKITRKVLEQLGDEDIISLLTQIKGVGRWSVEMLLAFSLGREDVFFADDLGIQQGMAYIYGWDLSEKKKIRRLMPEKARDYTPNATKVCLYIWEWKNVVKSKRQTSAPIPQNNHL